MKCLALAAAVSLAACGGSGGDDDDDNGNGGGGGGGGETAQSAEGFWSNEDFSALVTADGEMWAVEVVDGEFELIRGTIAPETADYTSDFTIYSGTDKETLEVTGTVTTASTITGTVTGESDSDFELAYDDGYETAVTLEAAVGTYALNSGPGTNAGTVSIAADGALAGFDAFLGCDLAGTVTPNADGKAYFTADITLGGDACPLAGAKAAGVLAALDADTLLGGFVLESGDSGKAYMLSRQ